MNLKQLESLVWVADLKSFRLAAERLNTTQPNVSTRIASLEGELGFNLFDRGGGVVTVTPQGREILDQARVILRECEVLFEKAKNPKLTEGVLKIGVTELVVQTWLRQFLNEIAQTFPSLTVELSVDISAKLDTELMDRSIDLAFHNAPFADENLVALSLGHFAFSWFAAPGLAKELGSPVTKEALGQKTLLTPARQTKPYNDVRAHFERTGGLKLSGSTNLATSVHMAIDSMGVALLPDVLADEAVVRGRLTRLDYRWAPDPLAFFARFDGERTPGFVRAAAEMAVEISAEHGFD